MSHASLKEPVIDINGFTDAAHKLKNVIFSNIALPDDAKVMVKDAHGVKFTHMESPSGAKPDYSITNSTDVGY